ncbi:hypothetical protein [Anoxybacillus gonensis]|jgi:type IV secretory pathway VirB6-like protein|uniref:hypothetical protein n=1 Tax=Anoxybacillus gonensis TaxID=198467 RepID=UPI0002BF9CEE|nr:hypothetical protein [Anoxybacillus gonensis]EMI11247.1 hypothetical protein F510_0660 [Anoxybacillus gonensis]
MESKFTISAMREIREKLDEIQFLAVKHYSDNSELFNIIDHLARVGGMFADVKVQELEGYVQTADPQDYILKKLSVAYRSMKQYDEKSEKVL